MIRNRNSASIPTVISRKMDVPGTPTIGTATNIASSLYNNGSATVAFTPSTLGGPSTSFTVTSSPGGFTASGASSPITVSGLQSTTQYTFTVAQVNGSGAGGASAASNQITANTAPETPTLGTVTRTSNTEVSIPFTAGANGGSAITGYSVVSSPSISLTVTGGTTSPLTVTGTFASGIAYTFAVTPINANGNGAATSASNAITPKPYAVGDIGPGGGMIFYDAGSTLSWGRYLEAARSTTSPSWVDATIGNKQLANDGGTNGNGTSIPGTSTAIGTGRANTTLIYAYDTSNGAAAYCRNYTGGGFSGATTGWFLPSRDELSQMYNQRTSIGGFNTSPSNTAYWSSSQYSLSTHYYVDFSNGSSSFQTKGSTSPFRAVRAF